MYLEDLIPALEMKMPDVTDDIYFLALQQASVRFFLESEVWTVPLDVIVVGSGAMRFDIDVPEDAGIHAIHAAIVDGEPLDSVSFEQVKSMQTKTGAPTVWYRNGVELFIGPKPLKSFNLELLGTLVPVPLHEQVATDSIMARYSGAILEAAMSIIATMPKKPWTDIAAARIAEARYEDVKLIARREVLGYLDKQSHMLGGLGNVRRTNDY